MELVKFTESRIKATGKAGIMTPDSDGYYTVTVGALNCYNSAGEYYTAEGALDLFKSSSQFMRRISSGALYAEVGHPKKPSDMSMDAYYNRVISIEETNVCAHFKEITLDFNFGKNNPEYGNKDIIAIIAKVKPAGPKANVTELAFNNPNQNAAFSIRGLTENKVVNGRTNRRLFNIITFDYVTEPGINIADKHTAPCLESIYSKVVMESHNDVHVDMNMLKHAFSDRTSPYATESTRSLREELLSSMVSTVHTSRLSNW